MTDDTRDPHDESIDAADSTTVSAESRTRAIQSLLVEAGLLSTDVIDDIIATYEHEIGPLNGARIVARAWTDPSYRERLLNDTTAAVADLGVDVDLHNVVLKAIENTESVHNVVVCTLCSCYPWAILGLPPTWYKSEAYRARTVREPRTMLCEDFDTDLPEDVELRVWDSTSELRYFILPQRPPRTEEFSETDLAELVTRDSMLGVDRLESAPTTDGGIASTTTPRTAFGVPLDDRPTFQAPWQARAFAVAVALTTDRYPWERFQSRLVDAVDAGVGEATNAETRYYEQWLAALEGFLVDKHLLTYEALVARATEFEAGDRTAEEWVEGHHGNGNRVRYSHH